MEQKRVASPSHDILNALKLGVLWHLSPERQPGCDVFAGEIQRTDVAEYKGLDALIGRASFA
ncbi:hypothetical protein D3C79_971800 [compost metagenome]